MFGIATTIERLALSWRRKPFPETRTLVKALYEDLHIGKTIWTRFIFSEWAYSNISFLDCYKGSTVNFKTPEWLGLLPNLNMYLAMKGN